MAGNDERGVEDAAILLMALGEESAAEVFKHLTPKEVQRLGEAITRTRTVARDRFEAVVQRFSELAQAEHMLVPDNNAYVKTVLRRALGEEKAELLLDRIVQSTESGGIESLKWMDAKTVGELLRNEHPQIVAAILAHLETDQASAVLKQLSERQRNEILLRVATLDGIQPAALKDLNEVLGRVLAGGERARGAGLGGAKATAEILNQMGNAFEASVLEFIRETDGELAQKIMDNMFTFDDLLTVDDRGIQILLKEVQSESLVIALKGASPELREKIFRNMSTRAAETLREDLEARGPVRLADVENEQKELIKVARRLADEGEIMIGGGGGDQFV